MEDTSIKIPDLRVKFSDDLPVIHFEGCKEVKDIELFKIYMKFESWLLTMPNAIKTTDGELLGWKDNKGKCIANK